MTNVLDPADPETLLRRIAALERRVRAMAVILGGGTYAEDPNTRTLATPGAFTALTGAPTVTVSVPDSGKLLVSWGFRGFNNASTASTARMAPFMTGANVYSSGAGESGGATVIIGSTTATTPIPASMTRLYTGLKPGTTTVQLQAYISSGSGTTNQFLDSWLLVEPQP